MKKIVVFLGVFIFLGPAAFSGIQTFSMIQKRTMHRSILLPDGNVLITGGVSSLKPIPWPLAHAELFLAHEKKFISLPSMRSSHVDHTLTSLSNGTVIIAGGNLSPEIEFYDTQEGNFKSLRSLQSPRAGHTAHVVNDRELFLIGGYKVKIGPLEKHLELIPMPQIQPLGFYDIISLNHCEVYDLLSQISSLIPLPTWLPKISFHRSLQLPSGNILIFGGMSAWNKVVELDVATRTFSIRGYLTTAREDVALLPLDDHRILISGGTNDHQQSLTSLEIFDLHTNTSQLLGAELHTPREDHTMVAIQEGYVLVAGGEITGKTNDQDIILNSAEFINIEKPEVIDLKDFFSPARSDHEATVLKDHSILFTGGEAPNNTILDTANLVRF